MFAVHDARMVCAYVSARRSQRMFRKTPLGEGFAYVVMARCLSSRRYFITPTKLNSSEHGDQHGISTEQSPIGVYQRSPAASQRERATSQRELLMSKPEDGMRLVGREGRVLRYELRMTLTRLVGQT